MDTFQLVIQQGYYFDCCIDLYAYNSDGKVIFILRTPSTGVKPEITVDGIIIPGNYDVSSHITIRNLSYQVDIDNVATIKARMYYAGLIHENIAEQLGIFRKDGGPGHWVEFSVLDVVQEGEPPNRATKFNCVVASNDFTHLHAPVKITRSILYGKQLVAGGNSSVQPTSVNETKEAEEKEISKTAVYKPTFLDFLVAIAMAYNKNPRLAKSTNKGQLNFTSDNSEGVQITKIRYEGVEAKELQFAFVSEESNISKLLASVEQAFLPIYPQNSTLFDIVIDGVGKQLYCQSAVVLSKNNIDFINKKYRKYFDYNISKVVEITKGGTAGQEVDAKSIQQKKSISSAVGGALPLATGGIYETTSESHDIKTALGLGPSNPIPLNFVKSAFKDQSYIKATIIFDDRVFPQCFCSIAGKMVMGRSGLGSGLKSAFSQERVIFQIVGGIRYNFSTVNGGTMSFDGVADPSWQQEKLGIVGGL